MTDHDTLDDAWAGRAFDRARGPHDEPHWLPDIAGAVRSSNRRRRRTRFATVAAVAVVAGLAATDYAALGGSGRAGAEPGSPASSGAPPTTAPRPMPSVSISVVGPPKGSSTTPPSPKDKELAAELAGSLRISWAGAPEYPLSEASAQTLEHLVTALDPTGAHLRQAGKPDDLQKPAVGSNPVDGPIDAYSMWTPDGDGTKPYSRSPNLSESYGVVAIDIVPALLKPDPITPCQSWAYGLFIDDKVDWAPCQTRRLADGSEVITTHSTSLGDRQIIVGVRKFPDGHQLNVSLANWMEYATANHNYPDAILLPRSGGYVQSPPIRPVPWTDQQLSDALSAGEKTVR